MIIGKRFQRGVEIVAIVVTSPLLLFFLLLVPIIWLDHKITALVGPTENWRRWFAWYPVRVGWWPPDRELVWLEWVERRGSYNDQTEYRNARSDNGPSGRHYDGKEAQP